MTVADSGGAVLLNITRTVRRFRIVPTALRTNQLYYNVYCVGLNTVFASVIPLLSLLYLNTRLKENPDIQRHLSSQFKADILSMGIIIVSI